MKTFIDFQASLTKDMLASKKFKHRLIKYWGTTYVNGVHVFNKTYQFFPHHKAERHRRLYRLLGIDKQMMETHMSRSQIDEAHFYFKKNRWTGVPTLEREMLANKINNFFPALVKKRLTLKIFDIADPSRFDGWTKEQILAYVDSNYETLINSTGVQTSAGTMAEDAVCLYAMLDNEGVFTVDVVNVGIAPVKSYTSVYTGTTSINENGDLVYNTKDIANIKSTLYLTLDITRNRLVLDGSQFIQAVMRENSELRLRNLEMLQRADENISYQEAIRRELDDDNNDAEENDFFIGKYLKVACTDSYFMSRDKFTRNIFNSLDTKIEYKEKEKLSTWEKIGLIAIIIIVIAVTIMSGGTLGPALTASIITMTVTMTYIVIQMVYAQQGETAKAEGMGSWVKVSGIISTIVNIIIIIDSVFQDMATEAAKEAAVESAKNSAATASADVATTAATQAGESAATQAVESAAVKAGESIVQESLEEFLQSSATEIIVPAAEGITVESGKMMFTYGGKTYIEIGVNKMITKAAELVLNLVSKREQSTVRAATERKTYLLDEANESARNVNDQLLELTDREVHLGIDDIVASTKMIKTSQAQFEVDYLYEGTRMNIGRPSFRPYGLNERVKIEYKI